MYGMWWHKPLLAKEPFLIRGEWIEPLLAFMYMSSEMSGAIDEKALKSETVVKTLFASLRLYAKVPEIDTIAYAAQKSTKDLNSEQTSSDSEEEIAPEPESERAYTLQRSGEVCLKMLEERKSTEAGETAFFERRPKVEKAFDEEDLCAETTRRRWELAASAIEEYPSILSRQKFCEHDDGGCIHFRAEELVCHRAQNWPWDDLLRNVGGLMVGVVLWFSNLCYGGIHASAWNEHFPSDAERWLWRTSAVYIGFCGGLWICLNWLTLRIKPLNDFWEKWMDGKENWFSNIVLGFLVVGCGGALCFARCFIVVEAFASIRSLPMGAYDTPDWTQVLPHF